MGKKTWTSEQIDKLCDLWGTKSYKSISRIVGHTETATRLKAKRIGLGEFKNASDYICAREISRIMGVDVHTITDYWIKKLGLPCKRIEGSGRTLYVMVRHDELVTFLKNNQSIFDSRRIKPYGLGCEPEWLHQKRLRDRMTYCSAETQRQQARREGR
ncbi:MAG: hypothetical protein NC434_10970 [Ruminococcus sp.]|nr:hypothetical protein [Ruminococcus sp.]